jgi:hypothetical protein
VPPPGNNGPPGSIFDSQSKEKRMKGDFYGSAHTLWTLYGKEAKSHDEARIQTLKEDMDGVLIFVRSYALHTYGFCHADCGYTGWSVFCRGHPIHNRK